jgi:hypothetical protein
LEKSRLKSLQIVALSVTIIGMLGSLVLMTHAGRHNRSVMLILMFTGWVSSPFLALLIAYFSDRWPVYRRMPLYVLMILIAIGSLIIYSGTFGIRGPHPAFVYLVTPLVSWILIGILFFTSFKKKTELPD